MLNHIIRGEGPPILILHGVTLDHRHMVDALEPVFSAAPGWQRIYLDLPGHGNSPARDEIRSQDDLLQAVIDFADDVLPGQTFSVIGLSRGSYLARGLIYRRPDRITGAALIVPGGNPSSDPARLPAANVLRPDPALRDELSEAELWAFDNLSVIQTREIVERRRAVIAPARALFDANQEARVFAKFDFSFADAEEQMQFHRPCVIIVGRQDAMSGYLDGMDLARRYTRSTLGVLDTAGHALTWERPGLFQSLIRDWLERLDH